MINKEAIQLLQETNGIPLTLKEQKIKVEKGINNVFKDEKSYEDFKSKSLYAVINKLKTTDEAFLNSILSCAVYEKRSWMSENLNKNFEDISPIIKSAIKSKDEMYDLKIWHFMKNTFEKIPDEDLKIPAKAKTLNGYNYLNEFEFKNGEFSTNNGLAHASILKSKNPDGDGYILHLSFRGTEFSRLFEYLKGPYLDMSAYYSNFEPLEKYIKNYIKDPKNNIKELHVNGHSLGGAMVQEFLKNTPKDELPIPVKGFTFGSPGSEKKWYHKLMAIAYHTIRGVDLPQENKVVKKDKRLHEFYHNNDPVPRIGLMGYKKNGSNYNLLDCVYNESKQAKLEKKLFLEKIPFFGNMITSFKESVINKFNTKFHDSGRYIKNLRNLIEEHFEAYPEFGSMIKSNSKNWENWIAQEKKFSTLSIKYRGAFEYLITQENPELTKKEISDKILNIREQMKYDSEAEIVLAKTKRTSESYEVFLNQEAVENFTKQENGERFMKMAKKISEDNQSEVTKNHNVVSDRIINLRNTYQSIMDKRTEDFKKKI